MSNIFHSLFHSFLNIKEAWCSSSSRDFNISQSLMKYTKVVIGTSIYLIEIYKSDFCCLFFSGEKKSELSVFQYSDIYVKCHCFL